MNNKQKLKVVRGKMRHNKHSARQLTVANKYTITKDKPTTTFDLAKLLNVFKLLGVLGSGAIITLTAIRAHNYSKYYDIPFSNFINIEISGELIIQIIPPIVMLIFIAIGLYFAKTKEVTSINKVFDYIFTGIMLAILGAYLCYLFCDYYLNIRHIPISKCMKSRSFIVLFFLLAIALLWSLVMYIVSCVRTKSSVKAKNKRKNDKVYEFFLCSLFTLIVSIYLVFILYFFIGNIINTYAIPENIKKYEIVTLKDSSDSLDEYVSVCTNSSGKLIMRCKVDPATNELTIYKGQYTYVKPDSCYCECVEFDNVKLSEN